MKSMHLVSVIFGLILFSVSCTKPESLEIRKEQVISLRGDCNIQLTLGAMSCEDILSVNYDHLKTAYYTQVGRDPIELRLAKVYDSYYQEEIDVSEFICPSFVLEDYFSLIYRNLDGATVDITKPYYITIGNPVCSFDTYYDLDRPRKAYYYTKKAISETDYPFVSVEKEICFHSNVVKFTEFFDGAPCL